MTPRAPEAGAREEIDRLLQAAGGRMCDLAEANNSAQRGVAIREFPLLHKDLADYRLHVDSRAAGELAAIPEAVATE